MHEKGLPRVCHKPLAAHLGQRLLLATDLSAASRPAERRAMQLAEQTDARLVILAVVPSRAAEHDAVGRLRARVRLARRRGTDASGQLVVGDPGASILQAAVTYAADTIVMGGSHWRGEAGCPCGHVILHSRCPVLVVNGAIVAGDGGRSAG